MTEHTTEQQLDWVAEDLQKGQALGQLQDAYNDERDLVNQLLGQAQMADAFAKFSVTVTTSKLAFVKENKLYKALKGKKSSNGYDFLKGTWGEFCDLLGISVEKADLDITNIRTFGEEALDSMSNMGIGYREMRQYRRLPEDQKLMLIEAAKTGDKEGFIDLAEELITKHAREKEELTKKLDEVTADHEAQGKVLADKNAKIDALATDLHKAKRLIEQMTPDEETQHMQEQVAGVAYEAEVAVRGNLRLAVNAVMERAQELKSNPRPFLAGVLLQLERAIHEIRAEHDIPAVVDGEVRPSVALLGQE